MTSLSLSVEGRGSCQTTVEVMKIRATSFQRSHACPATLSAPSPAAGHHRPHLCQRLLDTHRQVWVGLLWGQCSFLLGSGNHRVLCPLTESVFQSCISYGGSTVGSLATSSKRAYATPRSAAPRAPAPATVHDDLYLCRRHSNTVLSQSLWGLWVLVHTRYV